MLRGALEHATTAWSVACYVRRESWKLALLWLLDTVGGPEEEFDYVSITRNTKCPWCGEELQ